MKKLIYLFIPILFYSCSATKDKNAPINDYLETQNLGSQRIMIIKEKINNNITISIFEGQTFYYPEAKKYIKVEGVEEPLYDKELWKKMKAQYENKHSVDYWIKGSHWTMKDFKHQNILFFEREKFPNPGKYEQFNFDDYYTIFSFSEPIYYDKKYAVFTKVKTDTNDKTFADTSIIIMQKKNGKWKIIQDVDDAVHH